MLENLLKKPAIGLFFMAVEGKPPKLAIVASVTEATARVIPFCLRKGFFVSWLLQCLERIGRR
ncbi:MAG: hypothetical protein ACXWLB_10000 [Reyranella sp.]